MGKTLVPDLGISEERDKRADKVVGMGLNDVFGHIWN